MKAKHSWNWNGGHTITEHGYVLIFVGKGHHLADVRGYAYEHRLVAEKKLGRRLLKGEQVHHKNGIRSDNRSKNIEVMISRAYHAVEHRHSGKERRKPGEENIELKCGCGCGISLNKFDGSGRPRKFITGHNTIAQYKKETV